MNHDIAARRGPGLVRLITVTQERSFKITEEAPNVAVFPRRRIVEHDLVVVAEDRPEVRPAHLPGADPACLDRRLVHRDHQAREDRGTLRIEDRLQHVDGTPGPVRQ